MPQVVRRTGGSPDAATGAVKRWVSQSGRMGRPSGRVNTSPSGRHIVPRS
ncbi:hypothetical protein OHA25_44785 [Nonomuraea sp. NBC_00507]